VHLLSWAIDYQALVKDAKTIQEKRNCLGNGVTELASEIYKRLVRRPTLVDELEYNSFLYGFDNYSWLELKGKVPLSEEIEDRESALVRNMIRGISSLVEMAEVPS
jgi:hypothetical protein